MQLSLAEKAAQLRAARIEALLKKKETKVEFSLRKRLKKEQTSIESVSQTIESDDAQSPQRSASSSLGNTVEIKPNIHIPRPQQELSLAQLIAIAHTYTDPNAPYVVSMVIRQDYSVVKNYSDGIIVETPAKTFTNIQPFSGELGELVNWYQNEKNLPVAPFTRTTGFVSPRGTINTNKIKDHKAYYQMLNALIARGSGTQIGDIARMNVLEKELRCLKEIVKRG